MSNSRRTFSTFSINMILLAVSFFIGVESFSGIVEEKGSFSSQANWRMKRMNQISCHCCSHSFNSHCCLQCMSRIRIGKRSDAAMLNNVNQWTGIPGSLSEEQNENIQQDDSSELLNEALICSCCLQQIQRFPDSRSWSCCEKCYAPSDRMVKNDLSAGNPA